MRMLTPQSENETSINNGNNQTTLPQALQDQLFVTERGGQQVASATSFNLEMIQRNLSQALQNKFTIAARYIRDFSKWTNGEIRIPNEKLAGSYITATPLNPHSAQLIGNLQSDINRAVRLYGNKSNYLRLGSPSGSIVSITDMNTGEAGDNRISVTQAPAAAILDSTLNQYIAWAEMVDKITTQLLGEGWDDFNKARDIPGEPIACWSGKTAAQVDAMSPDYSRIKEALGDGYLAKLILHLRESELLKQQQTSSALVSYQVKNRNLFFTPEQVKHYRYLLSENHLKWIKHRIMMVIYFSSEYRLESKEESDERKKSTAILILTTNLRSLFSALELCEIVDSLTYFYFKEEVAHTDYGKSNTANVVNLITDIKTHFTRRYLNEQHAPKASKFFESLAPFFEFKIIIEKFKQERASAEFLFIVLFGDKNQKEKLEKLNDPHPYPIQEGSAFLEYDDLVDICGTHFDENKNDIFTRAYKILTGQDKPNINSPHTRNVSATDIEQAFVYLGLSVTATLDQVKKQYRKLVIQCHPDKNPDNPQAAARFIEINKYYEILSTHLTPTVEIKNSTPVQTQSNSRTTLEPDLDELLSQPAEPAASPSQSKPQFPPREVAPLSADDYRKVLLDIHIKIKGHEFEISGSGKKDNNDGRALPTSANIIFNLVEFRLLSNNPINKAEFDAIREKIRDEIKDKTEKTSGFLSIGARSLSTAELYKEILDLLNFKEVAELARNLQITCSHKC